MKTEQEKVNDLINWLVKSTENFIMTGDIKNNDWRKTGRMIFDKTDD